MRFFSGQMWAAAVAVLALGVAAPTAHASVTYSFKGVTNNNATNTADGVAQLKVTLNDLGGSKVEFKFTNTGSAAMSITDVYFDDGSLLGIYNIVNGPGVSFAVGASPGNLPGGAAINFNTSTPTFSVDSTSPTQPNGVNPGEYVTIQWNLIGGQTYADTVNAINLALANPGLDVTGGLRIGIHVQGFSNGLSDSFVNSTPTPNPGDPVVPAPAGVVLLASALPFAVALRRRVMRKTA